MPPVKNQIVRTEDGKYTIKDAPKEKLAVSLTNWLIGGDIVVPKSRRWKTRKASAPARLLGVSKNISSILKIRRRPEEYDSYSGTDSSGLSSNESDITDSSRLPLIKGSKNRRTRKAKAKKSRKDTAESSNASSDASLVSSTDGEVSFCSESSTAAVVSSTTTKEWTASQDAIITTMRGDGESWASIGQAIGCEAEEAEKRWEELTGQESNAESGVDNSGGETEDPKQPPAETGDRGKGNGAAEGNIKGQDQPAGIPPDSNVGPNIEIDASTEAIDQLRERQEFSIAQLSRLYEDEFAGKIKPNDNFSDLDCKLFGLLAAKRRAERWVELQSDFFNATGRMVPTSLLKHKWKKGKRR